MLLICGHCWDVERLLWISVIKDSTCCLLANLQVSSLSPAPNTEIETALFLCFCVVFFFGHLFAFPVTLSNIVVHHSQA